MQKTTMNFSRTMTPATINSNGEPRIDGLEMTVIRTKERYFYAGKKYLVYDEETGHLRAGNGPNKLMESVGGIRVVKRSEKLPAVGRIDTLYVSLADGLMRVWDEENYDWFEIHGTEKINMEGIPRVKAVDITIPMTGWAQNRSADYPYKVVIKNDNIAAGAIPELIFHGTGFDRAVKTGIAPYCETAAGQVTVYAVELPEKAISGTLTLIDLKRSGAKTAIGSTNSLGISGMVFKGATETSPGRRGLVPAPDVGDDTKVLLGDGTWGEGTPPPKYAPIPAQKGTLTYNGQAQSPEWIDFDNETCTATGTLSATEAGAYTVTFRLKDGYVWEDETYEPKRIQWIIDKDTITIPSATGTLTYNGKEQSPEWSNYNKDAMAISGVTAATDAGTYNAVFTLKPSYTWPDGSTGQKTVSWGIEKAKAAAPTLIDTSFIYTGEEQSPEIEGYDKKAMTMSGTSSAVNVSSYTVTFTLSKNYTWEDGSITPKSLTWWITDAMVDPPVVNKATFTYDGEYHSPAVSDYNTAAIKVKDTPRAVNAGEYQITYYLAPNYKWSDGTTEPKTYKWRIGRVRVEKPTLDGKTSFQYGTSINVMYKNYDPAKMTRSLPNINGTGTYTATFTPRENYEWTDGTRTAVSLTFKITPKLVAIPTGSPLLFTYNGSVQGPNWKYDSDYVKIVSGIGNHMSETTPRIYYGLFQLKDTKNCIWADGDTSIQKSVQWTIVAKKVQVPTIVKSELTYNGKAQFPEWNNPDNVKINEVSQTNPGVYTVAIVPDYGCVWKDGTTDAVVVQWKIIAATVKIPVMLEQNLTYDGKEHKVLWKNYPEGNGVTKDTGITYGNNSKFVATDAGIYGIVLVLKNKTYCAWTDGTTGDKSYSWEIKKYPLDIQDITCNVREGETATVDIYFNAPEPIADIIAPKLKTSIDGSNPGDGVASVTFTGEKGAYKITAKIKGSKKGTENGRIELSSFGNYRGFSKKMTITIY